MIKIGSELRKARENQGYTIEQVAKATKIRPQFLSAIENGEYSKLPGSSYAVGFVKNYVEFLGLSTTEYLPLFRREYNEKENRNLIPESMVGKEHIRFTKFSMWHTIVLAIGVIFLVGIYLLFQYKAALINPQLQISRPREGEKITGQAVLVEGSTDPNSQVTVNTLPTFVDNAGKFSKEIPVFAGNITLTIKSINSFGKISTIERHITVQITQ